jgi:hypothetical protein
MRDLTELSLAAIFMAMSHGNANGDHVQDQAATRTPHKQVSTTLPRTPRSARAGLQRKIAANRQTAIPTASTARTDDSSR